MDLLAEQAVRGCAGGVRRGHAGPVAQRRAGRRRGYDGGGSEAVLRGARQGRRAHRVGPRPVPQVQGTAGRGGSESGGADMREER